MTIQELIQAKLERVPEDQLEEVYRIIKDFNEKRDEESSDWDALADLLKDCQVETGISDLSYQHDHYLHRTPKREEV